MENNKYKVLHIVGYIIGGFFVFIGLFSLPSFSEGVMPILFGLSLFHIIFEKIKNLKFIKNNKFILNNLVAIRVILSVALFFTFVALLPPSDENKNNEEASSVIIEVESLSINSDVSKMKVGEDATLTIEITPQNATDKVVKWESTNLDVATVDSSGVVRAISNGEVTIIAKSSNGKVAEHKIVVKGNKNYYYVGDTVKCDSFEITLNDYIIKGKGTRIDSYSKISDPEWIGVILTVRNISNYELTYGTSNVKLQNSNGEIIDPSFITYAIWGKDIPLLKSPTLAAGGVKKGYIQYANNNTDNSNLLLKVGCADKIIFEDTTYIFELVK